jgi:hypothetical protein
MAQHPHRLLQQSKINPIKFMAWNNQGGNRPKTPSLFHSEMVKRGPTILTIKSAPRMVKNGTMCVTTVVIDGEEHGLFAENEAIAEALKSHVGQQVTVIASGSRDSATLTVQPAGQQQAAQAEPQHEPQQQAAQPASNQRSGDLRGAKVFFCQAANLMRLAAKKAADVATEFSIDEENQNEMRRAFFYKAFDQGLLATMPIDPFTPQELGWGAASQSAQQPAYQEPPQQEEESVPF